MNPQQPNNSLQIESFGILRRRYSERAIKISQIKMGKNMASQKNAFFQDDHNPAQKIWHKRMMESKSYDAQVIVKMERIIVQITQVDCSTPLLILMFLTAFVIIFLLTPMQTYHPTHE